MSTIPNETRQYYPDTDEFYRHDLVGAARKASREWDLGVWWYDNDRGHPVYRITFVELSNEVIAVCLGGNHRYRVEVIASGIEREQVDAALDGWGEICGQANSMDWIREKLRDFPVKVVDE